ncbi:MAG: hypothetical protein HC927_07375 [Deltaproteobacteria bacterium]|nr:hypothetical protein [Deltaproteobacteria bacterium]
MNETSAPSFDWTHFHGVAARLLALDGEAALRSAVSRDYYAVFHAARSILADLDPSYRSPIGHESHLSIWHALAALQYRQSRSAAGLGRSLLSARTTADYHRQARDWPKLAQSAHEQSRRALAQLQDLKSKLAAKN